MALRTSLASIIAVLSLLSLCPRAAEAQRRIPPRFEGLQSTDEARLPGHVAPLTFGGTDEDRIGPMIGGGLSGGALGALVGGGAAWALGNAVNCYDMNCLWLLLGGVAVGESVGIPLGVHFANERRGDLAGSTAASGALGAIGLGLVFFTRTDRMFNTVALAVPLAQIGLSITMEQTSAPPR